MPNDKIGNWTYQDVILAKGKAYCYKDKTRCINSIVNYKQLECLRMFEYTGLPDTIPQYMLELMLQINGHCFITNDMPNDNNLRCYTGALGGVPDVYYIPTKYVVANPVAGSKTLDIENDGVLCKNDHLMMGLQELHTRFATLLVENELSIYCGDVLIRALFMITATNDSDKLTADDFIKSLEKGDMKSVLTKSFIDGVKGQPLTQSSNNMLTQLIEMEQYIKASWQNSIGLDANYNMKRESLSMTESQMNDDSLMPLPDEMLTCRKELCDAINSKFGLAVSVDFSSSWKKNHIEMIQQEDDSNMETTDESTGDEDVEQTID